MGDYGGRLCTLGEQASRVARVAADVFLPTAIASGVVDGLNGLMEKAGVNGHIPAIPDPSCKMPPKTCEDAGKPAAVAACRMRMRTPSLPAP